MKKHQSSLSLIFTLLLLSVFFIFIGRAWQHLFWDAPYRSFFWNENALKPVVEFVFQITWQEYATSTITDNFIQLLIQANGFLFLIAALVTFLFTKTKTIARPIIFLGGISLTILAILLTKEKFYHLAQFFEHSIQFGLPFVFLYYYKSSFNPNTFIFTLKILIAITFFSHGLYAFGFYPVPGKFIDMTINTLHCSEQTAYTLLYIAGILDFILAILIFIPQTSIAALWYAVFWGSITAFARILANFDITFLWDSLHQYLYQVIYRLPHGLVPLLTLLLIKKYPVKTEKPNAFAKI
ncbi:hypothetical protein [Aquimarina rhabdastrellae]